jgi:2-keto-4-pentenoate hydratase/2-oxohepta-3-ene-1,7-dioic acid hydratase in catechol pathway
MRLLSLRRPDGTTALCQHVADEFIDLTSAGLPATLDELLTLTADLSQVVADAANRSTVRYAANSRLHFLPPVANPSKAIAVGLNYAEHAKEGSKPVPTYPVLFQRYRTSWTGHQQPLHMPRVSEQFDYEGELVVVIGKGGRYITKEQALSHVAGYSIFNEGSVRDYQRKSTQYLMGKNFDCSGAFGPVFVTADELPAGARGLRLQTRLNGQVVQDSNTNEMIFDVATLIAECSNAFALTPGDIIITGTPSGVGFARQPPLFMRPGDTCEVDIEGIGTLSNTVSLEP